MDLKRALSFPPYPGDHLHPVVYACTAVLLLCVLISLITYTVHHSIIRISRSGWHMLLNFLFHIAVTFGVFAGGINQISYSVICQVVGIVLHYSSLSSLLWLLFTARNICKEVSKAPPIPQDRDPPMQPRAKATIFRFYLVCGGVPLIIVGVTSAVSLDNYGSRDDAPYCWMVWEVSLGGFYGPAIVLVLVMCIYFFCTFVQLRRHPERRYELKALTEEQQHLAVAEISHCHAAGGETGERGEHTGCTAITASMLANEHSFKAQLRATAFTLVLFLATWAFGALAVSQGHFLDMIFSCLYGAFSVTLGLFLLIQHCAKRDDVWHQWWACCPNKPKMEVHKRAAENTGPPTQTHCQTDSFCPGNPLLSPHLHSPSLHCKLSPLPSTQNHTGICCATLHSPAPLLESSTHLQSLADELPRPTLPLQSCLKDRSKTRPFSRSRPSLSDHSYHMTSRSMDGSMHSSHLDAQLSCHSPHPGNQLHCPSPCLHLKNLSSHGMHDSVSCQNVHLDSHFSCPDGHACHRHMSCAKSDPFLSVCCSKVDPVVSSCQAEDADTALLAYSFANKEENVMLLLDLPPPRASLSCSQATPGRKGALSRRGTLSRNSSQHEDYQLTSDVTGNIRTGPWKNETTV